MKKFLMNKIDPYYFLIFLCIGFLICYLTIPRHKIILKQTKPHKTKKINNKNKKNYYKYEDKKKIKKKKKTNIKIQ